MRSYHNVQQRRVRRSLLRQTMLPKHFYKANATHFLMNPVFGHRPLRQFSAILHFMNNKRYKLPIYSVGKRFAPCGQALSRGRISIHALVSPLCLIRLQIMIASALWVFFVRLRHEIVTQPFSLLIPSYATAPESLANPARMLKHGATRRSVHIPTRPFETFDEGVLTWNAKRRL